MQPAVVPFRIVVPYHNRLHNDMILLYGISLLKKKQWCGLSSFGRFAPFRGFFRACFGNFRCGLASFCRFAPFHGFFRTCFGNFRCGLASFCRFAPPNRQIHGANIHVSLVSHQFLANSASRPTKNGASKKISSYSHHSSRVKLT